MSGPSGTHTHSHVLTVHRTMAPVRTHLILFTGGPCSGAHLSGQFRPPLIGQKWQVSRRGPPITDALTLGHFGTRTIHSVEGISEIFTLVFGAACDTLPRAVATRRSDGRAYFPTRAESRAGR